MSAQTLIRARKRLPIPPPLQTAGSGDDLAWLYSVLGGLQPSGSLPVTDQTVRGIPAAWAALNKISNAVGQMMADAECYAADGITEIECPPVVDQPDVALGSYTYWKMVAATAITQGNYVGIKADFDADGYPRQVVPVPSGSLHAYYDDDGYVVYEVGGERLTPDDVVHVRVGITSPGQVMTIGVIEAHRRGLAGCLDQQGMANSVWKTGAVPSGVVQLAVDLPTQQQATDVKANWIGAVGGQRTVAVIGQKMTYTPITWNADDAQFIEAQQLTVAQVALMFGLHPSDLDASIGGSGMTYANRSDNALERIVDAYTPVMLPIEQEWSRLVPGKNFVRGNPEAMLRSTTRERYELHGLAQQTGLETRDESRAAEGKPPLPPPPPAPTAPTAPALPAGPAVTDPATGDPAVAPVPMLLQVPRKPSQG